MCTRVRKTRGTQNVSEKHQNNNQNKVGGEKRKRGTTPTSKEAHPQQYTASPTTTTSPRPLNIFTYLTMYGDLRTLVIASSVLGQPVIPKYRLHSMMHYALGRPPAGRGRADPRRKYYELSSLHATRRHT